MQELHNLFIEANVLVSLMTVPDSFEQLPEGFKAEVFYAKPHQDLFRVITGLVKSGREYDLEIVCSEVELRGLLVDFGGKSFVEKIYTENSTGYANLNDFCLRLMDFSARRYLEMQANIAIKSLTASPELTAAEISEKLTSKLADVSSVGMVDNTMDASQAARAFMEAMASSKFSGSKTGFTALDEKIGGIASEQLIVIAARPAMGKSLLMQNIVEFVEATENKPVLIFSMEMAVDQLAGRSVSSRGNLHNDMIKKNEDWAGQDWERLQRGLTDFASRKIFINDDKRQTPDKIRNISRRYKRLHGGLACIAVDYIQLMEVPGFSAENKNGLITEITRKLKILAGEMKCPVIALSQLNRALEKRPNKRPMLSDLRESGAIEQDADVIIFIYRDEVYDKNTKYPGIAELIIGKQRSGQPCTVPVRFNGAYSRFENLYHHIDLEAS